MSDTTTVCLPPPDLPLKSQATDGTGPAHAVLTNKLWPIGTELYYMFLDGKGTKKAAAVEATIRTWYKYANVLFVETTTPAKADIRISFTRPGSWAYTGTAAKDVVDLTEPTLNLGDNADTNPPSDNDRGNILHEFGHVLGMMHEHQSPIRGGRINLKEDELVYNFYTPLLNNDRSKVKRDVIDQYNLTNTSNFSHLDLDSIMIYAMPGYLNKEGLTIPRNNELSIFDKAYITLTYPGVQNTEEWSITRALDIAGVPSNIAGEILRAFGERDYDGVRNKFRDYKMGIDERTLVNRMFMSIDPTNSSQFGVRDSIAKVIQNPLFKGILKTIVGSVFESRAIPTVNSVPGSAQNDVVDTIGTIATNPTFAESVASMNTFFSGVASSPMK